MSDTPRTDDHSFQLPHVGGAEEIVNADFARTLERELAAVTKERDAEYDRGRSHELTEGAWEEIKAERDELAARLKAAEEDAALWKHSENVCDTQYNELLAERDSLLSRVQPLVDALTNLRNAISEFNGHGMPGFTDRASAYIVMQEADEALAQWSQQQERTVKSCPTAETNTTTDRAQFTSGSDPAQGTSDPSLDAGEEAFCSCGRPMGDHNKIGGLFIPCDLLNASGDTAALTDLTQPQPEQAK